REKTQVGQGRLRIGRAGSLTISPRRALFITTFTTQSAPGTKTSTAWACCLVCSSREGRRSVALKNFRFAETVLTWRVPHEYQKTDSDGDDAAFGPGTDDCQCSQ